MDGGEALQHAQARLTLANQALARTKQVSNGQRKAARRLGTTHARVRQLRSTLLHNITSALAANCSTVVVVEDLNVAGMLRNRSLARHVSDAAFGQLRRQLQYKSSWCGTRLALIDAAPPLSTSAPPAVAV